MVKIQAIIFNKHLNDINYISNFLRDHNLRPIKEPRETNNFIRFRLLEPEALYKKYHMISHIIDPERDIQLILAIKKLKI